MTTVLIPSSGSVAAPPAGTVDWPTGRAFVPASFALGVKPARSTWEAVYTRQRTQVTHLADRMTASLALPPCMPAEAGEREAWMAYLAAASPWVRLQHFARPVPAGTMRGTPQIGANVVAGSMSVQLSSVTPGATLRGGDMLGVGGRLLMVGLAGAVAAGDGTMTVPLALPVRAAMTAGAAVTWDRPTGTFQIEQTADLMYSPGAGGAYQGGLELSFLEVV